METRQANKTRHGPQNQHQNHREGGTVYRAAAIDLVSREEVGRFTYSADSIEEARQRAWRIAGSRFGNGIDVRIERLSK